MEFGIIISQIVKLILLVLVGVFIRKKGIVSDEGTTVLTKLMLNITLPILTFFSITSYKLPPDILKEGLFIICFAITIQLFSLFVGSKIAKGFKLVEIKKNVFSAQLMISNTVFLAFPLLTVLYGEIGLIYGIVYYLVSLTFSWTLGIYLFNKHEITNKKQIISSLINPCTMAFFIGMIALVLRIDIAMEKWPLVGKSYQFMYDTFYPLGNTTMSLSMIFIGLLVGQMDLKKILEIFKTRSIQMLVVTKLILIPLIFLIILSFMKNWVSEVALGVVFIEVLMPAGTTTVAIAKDNGSDYMYAMEIAIGTTIVSVITIPLLLNIFHYVIF